MKTNILENKNQITNYSDFFHNLDRILDDEIDSTFKFNNFYDINNPNKYQDLVSLTNDFFRCSSKDSRELEPDDLFENAINNGFFLDKDPNQLMMCAIRVSSINYLKLAINKGANINNENFYTSKYDLFENVATFNVTPIKYVCFYGDFDIFKLLIENGADLFQNCEDKDYSPLHIACHFGNSEIVKFLIENGADINELSQYEKAPPIAFSLFRDFNETCNLLIKHGANLNSTYGKYEHSIAHVAIVRDNYKLLEILFEHGFNPNITDKEANSVLHWAILGNKFEMVKLLISYGADINSLNDENENAITHANNQQHYEIRDFLVHYSRSEKLKKLRNRINMKKIKVKF